MPWNRREWIDLHGQEDYPPDGRDRYEDDDTDNETEPAPAVTVTGPQDEAMQLA